MQVRKVVPGRSATFIKQCARRREENFFRSNSSDGACSLLYAPAGHSFPQHRTGSKGTRTLSLYPGHYRRLSTTQDSDHQVNRGEFCTAHTKMSRGKHKHYRNIAQYIQRHITNHLNFANSFRNFETQILSKSYIVVFANNRDFLGRRSVS